jgi:hypothetical protein
MALQDPPHHVPRIVEVIEPQTVGGIHIVHVRMPTQIEAKWPKVPWQTTIESIGVGGPEAAKFKGYVLVDTQAMKGSPDLLWVFTKLPGKVVTESEWNNELKAQVKRTSQYVAPPTVFTDENTGFKKATWGMHVKQTEVVPTDELAAFARSRPVRVALNDLPRELLSVNVVWNSQFSIGTQDYLFYKWASGTSYSLGKSASDSASSAASVTPEIQLKFRDVVTNNLFGVEHEFYLPNDVTQAQVLARLNTLYRASLSLDPGDPDPVALWPVFRPESETISTTGQSINVRSNVQVSLEGSVTDGEVSSSGYDRGQSDDFSVNLNVGSVQLPACIHGAVAFTGDTARSQSVSAVASMSMYNSLVGSISASKTKSGTAYGVVSPTALTATSPTTIPSSGLYLMNLQVQDYRWDYSRVIAIVFDAANLA